MAGFVPEDDKVFWLLVFSAHSWGLCYKTLQIPFVQKRLIIIYGEICR